jgi:oxygen-independent coproporphyrinogen-3 oxidase
MIPLSLYIHIPWCIKKCPYCDFNSHKAPTELPESQYVKALLDDLESEMAEVNGRTISTIFIGGGTPSLFSAKAIDSLLEGIQNQCNLEENIEITLEANPGTFEQERFNDYRKSGINRLSIGIQSYNPKHLSVLGRVHNSDEAICAAQIATQAGFDNFNLDLMFGLPEQTTAQALDDLRQAINCNPSHLSWYQLTLEPNTLFHHNPPLLPDHESQWEIQQAGQALLAESNYEQYEVSAYAKNQRMCKHNLNYWQFGDYVGIGAGAHGKLTDLSGAVTRYQKFRQPKQYLEEASQGRFRSSSTQLASSELPFEFMLNALRLKSGIEPAAYQERTGQLLSSIKERVDQVKTSGLLQNTDERIVCTEHGWQFLDDTLSVFL